MKKIIYCLFLIMLFFSTVSLGATLHQEQTESQISSGTILKNYKLLTDNGWLNINILEIDLEDKYTNIGLLTASDGAGKLKNILSMANESNAIAAVNGDFFSGSNGKGHSIGLSINDSKIISSFAKENLAKNSFASFLLDEDNNVFYEFLTNEIILTSKKTKKSINIDTINKYSENYATPALYTNDWGTHSIGSSDTLALTEMVVQNNKVKEIRINKPAVEIPKNGFVISTLGDGADFINNNFKKGTRIELETSLIPDIEDIEFAISGGAQLLKDGEIPTTFSHNVSGRNPRTALGTDKRNKTLYLITVDGRQNLSIGMTQSEFAEFLKNIGIYNAINLDGGGSTSMVARKSGNFELATINNPSGGYLRSVINGVGIFSSAPNSKKLYGLNILVEDTNLFKDEEREIKVTGFNKYYNPVEIDVDDIKWTYDGVEVKIENGKISGNVIGTSIIKASIGKISTELEINILSDANELFISPKQTSISPGEKINYVIQAKNKNGYYAKTVLTTINAKIEEFYLDGEKQDYIPEDATLNNFTFTATTSGTYILSFSKGAITTYALVNVAADNFETNIKIPKDIKLEDSTNKKITESETFEIALIDTILEPNLMIDYFRNKILLGKINNADLAIVTQEPAQDLLDKITIQKIIANKYDLIETDYATFITLDISKNSLRLTDYSQWIHFRNDIKDSEKENIFIILNKPLDDFEDIEERKIFIDTLCELKRELKKNIIVLHTGYYTDYSMERGVKFLGINTHNIAPENIAKEFSYILISVSKNEVSYEIKKIF